MTPVHKILYFSTATTFLTLIELERLVVKSEENNRAMDITGILIYKNSMFAQLLEGEKSVIKNLFYEKIIKDIRHKNVSVIVDAPDNTRLFPSWDMNFYNFNNEKIILPSVVDSDLKIIDKLNKFINVV